MPPGSGKRLTVTDPDATRFFMTAAEAASLVLKAAVSGESGEVFWLDMGQPLRLGDLVDRVLDAATPAGHAAVRDLDHRAAAWREAPRGAHQPGAGDARDRRCRHLACAAGADRQLDHAAAGTRPTRLCRRRRG